MQISTRQEIFNYLDNNPRDKPRKVSEKFPKVPMNTVYVYIRQWKKERYKKEKKTNISNNIQKPIIKISPGMKITKESLEPLIATAIKENPSNIQILRLAVDFCKINESEEDVGEIDMNKFLKILEE